MLTKLNHFWQIHGRGYQVHTFWTAVWVFFLYEKTGSVAWSTGHGTQLSSFRGTPGRQDWRRESRVLDTFPCRQYWYVCCIDLRENKCVSITVRDCEFIRNELLSNASEKKWTLLGQSFGGFVALNYLSFFPEGLKEVFLTGGLAPLLDDPDPAYEKTVSKLPLPFVINIW